MKAGLTEGSVPKHLLELALPMSFGIFVIITFNLVDTYFISQLGNLELAAITFTFPIPMLVAAISFGIGIAVSSHVSRALGAGDERTVSEMTSDALVLALALVSIVAVVGYFTIDPIFVAMGAGEDVLPFIRDYMQIWFLGAPLLVIPMVGNSVIRALGNATFPAAIMAISGLVNAILDPILIFGIANFEGWGIKGAAWATLVSRFPTLIASFWMLHRIYGVLENPFTRRMHFLRNWAKLTSIAGPAFLTNLVGPLANAIVTKLVAQYGAVVVAGYGIGARVESMLTILIFGVASSLGPFVGQNYGAKKYERIRRAIGFANSFPLVWTAICLLFMVFFSETVVRFFSDDPKIVEAASRYLLIVTLGLLGTGLLQNAVAVFNVLGQAKVALMINIFKMCLVYIPFAILLGYSFAESGVYSAALVAHLASGGLIYFYLHRDIGKCQQKRDNIRGYHYSHGHQ